MARILFIAAHRPNRSPSQRFRFESYFDFLQSNGYECKLKYIISEKTDRIFYHPKSLLRKSIIFLQCFLLRIWHVMISGGYDIIFIQREAFMTGSIFFEQMFKKSGAKIIFDFDDAIWKHDVSAANKKLGWLKRPGKTADIIALADVVIAGNSYLQNFAARYNSHIVIIPTTIDTEKYTPQKRKSHTKKICIGWSGSITTIRHFEMAIPVLLQLKEKYADAIYFNVMGDEKYYHHDLNIKGKAWNSATEVDDLNEFDIGIMPLPDDEWTKGKCALKGLQYMALQIPTVMSPVGVNNEIIIQGENGYLCSTNEEWFAALSLLIDDTALRSKTGIAARHTVEQKFSIAAQENSYLDVFKRLINTEK